MTKIAFIDDHILLRSSISNSLKTKFDACEVYEYNNGLEFINRFPKEAYTPDIILMDIRMSPMNGYETTTWVNEHYPSIPILAFSDVVDIGAIIEISRRGAKGCTEKNVGTILQLPHIIERIIKGEQYYDTVETYKLVKKYLKLEKKNIHEGFSALTDKEIEVLKLAGEDNNTEEKAKKLFISKTTLAKHRSNIYKKLNITKAAALSKIAYKLGLIDK